MGGAHLCHTANRLAGGLQSGENMVTKGDIVQNPLRTGQQREDIKAGLPVETRTVCTRSTGHSVCRREGPVLRVAVLCLLPLLLAAVYGATP